MNKKKIIRKSKTHKDIKLSLNLKEKLQSEPTNQRGQFQLAKDFCVDNLCDFFLLLFVIYWLTIIIVGRRHSIFACVQFSSENKTHHNETKRNSNSNSNSNKGAIRNTNASEYIRSGEQHGIAICKSEHRK